jgi:hypothetical protein
LYIRIFKQADWKEINQMVMKNVFITLIIIAMTAPVFSQDLPEVDKISTSAGDVELFFIGHGSLMFRTGDFVIHIDPVKSSGKYENPSKTGNRDVL